MSIVGQTPNPGGSVVLDFGEDVSARALVVTAAPTGSLANTPFAQAIDCANVPGGGCNGTDTSPNHVLVTTEILAGPTAAAVPVTVVALAG